MSRSRRRTSIAGICKAESDRPFKRLSARLHRRAVKEALYRERDIIPLRNERITIYHSNKDGKGFFDAKENPKLLRK